MTGFRSICCPIDFSDASRLALEEAAELARRYEAALTILHVAEPVHGGPEMAFAPPSQLLEEGSVTALAAWKSDAERLRGGAVGSVLLSGPAAPAIVQYARDLGVDLIVMASHGRTGFRRLVLGSVAEQVIRTAPCGVLVVRHEVVRPRTIATDTVEGMPA